MPVKPTDPFVSPGADKPVSPTTGWRTKFDRRSVLVGTALAATGLLTEPVRALCDGEVPVFIAGGQKYDGSLVRTIRDGLVAAGMNPVAVQGKRVLLKPNLVEPTRAVPYMTTNPAIILASAEVFLGWGAKVTVGEGPGHVRDTEMALIESGVQEALDSLGLKFADLNYEEVRWVPNKGGASRLPGFFFPRSVVEADLVVSLPKMKTHHWAGMTAAMKNFYGVIPGIKYGWPKNVLHHHGIPQTIFDINASLPATSAIVDGIDCMEGDGPIMGSLKYMGLVVIGNSLPAVDATVARIMELRPERITYLDLASCVLGPIEDKLIAQRGEPWRDVASPFQILDEPHLRNLRAELVS